MINMISSHFIVVAFSKLKKSNR